MEVDMRGAENDEPEMSFRLGYQQGAIEVFCAIERFFDPATRAVCRLGLRRTFSRRKRSSGVAVRPVSAPPLATASTIRAWPNAGRGCSASIRNRPHASP